MSWPLSKLVQTIFTVYSLISLIQLVSSNKHIHTLLLNEAYTHCGFDCNECLKYLKINVSSLTMNISSTYPEWTDSTCKCPSYTVRPSGNNKLTVYQNGKINPVGSIEPNDQHIQFTLNYWNHRPLQTICDQHYIPNTDHFMTVSSYKAFEIIMDFNHNNTYNESVEARNNNNFNEIELMIEHHLNDLFDSSWIYNVSILHVGSSNELMDNCSYDYTISVTSFDQNSTKSVLELQSIYIRLEKQIYIGVVDIVSNSFNTNTNTINGFSSYFGFVLSSSSNETYTMIYHPGYTVMDVVPGSDKHTNSERATVIIFLIVIGSLLCAAICSLICCKWKENIDDNDGDLQDPKYIYKNQDEINKQKSLKERHLQTITITHESEHNSPKDGSLLEQNVSISCKVLQAMNEYDVGAISIKIHDIIRKGDELLCVSTISANRNDENDSIRIVRADGAKLRAKSLSYAQMNVSERVLTIESKENELGKHIYTNVSESVSASIGKPSKNSNEKIYMSTELTSATDYVYDKITNGASTPIESEKKATLDIVKEDEVYVENVCHASNKKMYDGSANYAESTQHRKKTQLQMVPHDKLTHYPAPVSKIDDDLNKAKHSNNVMEYTNFAKDFQLITIIGKGSFGKVYKAKCDAGLVAIKLFTNVSTISTQLSVGDGSHGLAVEQYKELYAEIVLATSIPPHPNIIRINGFCRKPLCVVMEYMAGGSVQKLVYGLTNKPTPSVTEKFVILIKTCYGLAKLTEYGLHHRDIAARNILLGQYTTSIDNNTKVKVTDFGMTRKDDTDNTTKEDGGPYKWMAPESIQKQKYNEKTDVYMFGITIWEIMYGKEPYENVDAINAAMSVCMKHERPEFLWDLPSGLKTLIKRCWSDDPEKRPTFRNIAYELQRLQQDIQLKIGMNKKWDHAIENNATVHNDRILQLMDDYSDSSLIKKGHPKDNDFMHIPVCVQCDEEKELWAVPEFDRQNLVINIGPTEVKAEQIKDITRDKMIILIENNLNQRYRVEGTSISHSKWFEKKLILFKRFADAKQKE